jgi:DNA-binding MarR family transcriptional regulator
MWTKLLRAHAVVAQQLGSRLLAAYGLTINDYETLAALSRAPRRRMRRTDLARHLLLTPSGVTRLLARLTGAGLVARTSSNVDLRVAYAQLTEAGAAKLEAASGGHADAIQDLLQNHLSASELTELGDLLDKLADAS